MRARLTRPFVSVARARDVLRSAFWLLPALCVTVSIGLAIGLIALDKHLGTTHVAIVFPGPPEGARSFLSSIIQAMISFTGLVFSITIVVLQLSSGQFSPRVLRTFLRDRTIQVALGVFVATFVYAMVVLRAVQGTAAGAGYVPQIAVTVAFVFVLLSVALFIRYIDHVANLVRVATIIDTIHAEFTELLERRYPTDPRAAKPTQRPPRACRVVPAPRSGVVVSVNEGALINLAAEAQCIIAVVPRIGDFVPSGAPLMTVHRDGDTEPRTGCGVPSDDRLTAEVAFDTERTAEQDLAFGFRQLIDIAVRALSPGINDPTTAAQALDALHDLLRRLATRHLPDGRHTDRDGAVRLIVPQYGFADFLTLAVGEVWRYGADSAQIPGRLRSMLADLTAATLPVHYSPLAQWSTRLALEHRP